MRTHPAKRGGKRSAAVANYQHARLIVAAVAHQQKNFAYVSGDDTCRLTAAEQLDYFRTRIARALAAN